jgi:predicted phosphodiesterase
MSIYVTGDTHGYLAQILQIEQYAGAELKEGDYLLICGDFGFVFL